MYRIIGSGWILSKFGLHTVYICIYMSYNMEVRGKAWKARGCSKNGPKSEIDRMRSRSMRPSGLGRGALCGTVGAWALIFAKKNRLRKFISLIAPHPGHRFR